ncbi:MAG: hypothetical protein ACRDPC_27875, partial [Solirubrobacteraceae bacterium]
MSSRRWSEAWSAAVRLPIRVRLTVWYALLLAAIVVALGAFLVLQLRADLQAAIDRDVREASVHIADGYADEGAEEVRDLSLQLLPGSGAVAQVVDPGGRVLVGYGEFAGGRAIVPARVRAEALASRSRMLTVMVGGEHFRALASPVSRDGDPGVLVVAESLEEVEESVERVLMLLLLAGPAALAATAVGGWWLARKALRPVERMTAEA